MNIVRLMRKSRVVRGEEGDQHTQCRQPRPTQDLRMLAKGKAKPAKSPLYPLRAPKRPPSYHPLPALVAGTRKNLSQTVEWQWGTGQRTEGPSSHCFSSRNHETLEHSLPSGPTNKMQSLVNKRQNFHLDQDPRNISAHCQNSTLPTRSMPEVVPGSWGSRYLSLPHRATPGGSQAHSQLWGGTNLCLEGNSRI